MAVGSFTTEKFEERYLILHGALILDQGAGQFRTELDYALRFTSNGMPCHSDALPAS
jgi:hypothetical protein